MAAISTGAADGRGHSPLRLAREVVSLYAPLGRLAQLYVALRLTTAPLIATERFFPADGEVLDLGCGHGIFAHLLRLGAPKREVFGLDTNAARIEAARKTAPADGRLRFEVGEAGGFPERRFPVIAVVDLLHHMPWDAQETLLRRVADAVLPGGTVVVKDLEKRPRWKYFYHYLQDWIMYRGQPLYFREREDMIALLRRIGLDVSVHPLAGWRPYPHVVYHCRRPEGTL
jgi:2-polyprenyl-3-methyl-5-hydroxy-6-metoxy-1,4-benzoquinol methylase